MPKRPPPGTRALKPAPPPPIYPHGKPGEVWPVVMLSIAGMAVLLWLGTLAGFMVKHHRFPVGGGELLNWIAGLG